MADRIGAAPAGASCTAISTATAAMTEIDAADAKAAGREPRAQQPQHRDEGHGIARSDENSAEHGERKLIRKRYEQLPRGHRART